MVSNHNIGYEMASVVAEMITFRDQGEVSEEAIETLIHTCIDIINTEDGNIGEFHEGLKDEDICPRCLKQKGHENIFYCDDDNLSETEKALIKKYNKSINYRKRVNLICPDCCYQICDEMKSKELKERDCVELEDLLKNNFQNAQFV